MSHLNVIDFPVPEYREPVKTLRNLADEIETGQYGDVTSCGIVIFGDTMSVFGSGTDNSAPTIALLFNAAALRLAKSIEEFGEE